MKKEGVSGLYKGATPPLIGWMFMDSVMLGSLTFYRRLLHENFFSRPPMLSLYCSGTYSDQRLPTLVRFFRSTFPSRALYRARDMTWEQSAQRTCLKIQRLGEDSNTDSEDITRVMH